MVDKLVFACKALSKNATRAAVEVAVEACGAFVSAGDVPPQHNEYYFLTTNKG
jgi:hypothetical protein